MAWSVCSGNPSELAVVHLGYSIWTAMCMSGCVDVPLLSWGLHHRFYSYGLEKAFDRQLYRDFEVTTLKVQ